MVQWYIRGFCHSIFFHLAFWTYPGSSCYRCAWPQSALVVSGVMLWVHSLLNHWSSHARDHQIRWGPGEASLCLCREKTSFESTYLCQPHVMLNQVSAWHCYHVLGLPHAGYSMDTPPWCLQVDVASWRKSGAKLTQLAVLTHSLVLWLVGHSLSSTDPAVSSFPAKISTKTH